MGARHTAPDGNGSGGSSTEEEGLGGLSFFSEDMHNTCMSACAEADELHNAACEADEYGPNGQLLNPAPGINYDDEDDTEQ